jgi:putative transposase
VESGSASETIGDNLTMSPEHKGWYARNLPHFDGVGATQFVTFRLFDSLPQDVLNLIEVELQSVKTNIDRVRFQRKEKYLDVGMGSCLLREKSCAEIVRDSILFLDGKSYGLKAYVVMPNHVHLLVRFEEGQFLSQALHSLKLYTGHELKKLYPEMPHIWQDESFDRYMRNKEHFLKTLSYIHQNPVKAKLCASPQEYQWSSAYQSAK